MDDSGISVVAYEAARDATPAKPAFVNPDGSAATWVEQLSPKSRRRGASKAMLIALVVATSITAIQAFNSGLPEGLFVGGLVLVIGAARSTVLLKRTLARHYSRHSVPYTRWERLLRVGMPVGLGILFMAFSGGRAMAADWLAFRWMLAAGVLLWGIGVHGFVVRARVELTPAGHQAKVHFEEIAPRREAEARAESWWSKVARYVFAVAFACGAYYFAFVSTGKGDWKVATSCLLLATFAAYELSAGLVAVALFVSVGYGVISALGLLASSPVAIAIIIGALIIAAAAWSR